MRVHYDREDWWPIPDVVPADSDEAERFHKGEGVSEIPDELFRRFVAARTQFLAVCDEVDAWASDKVSQQ